MFRYRGLENYEPFLKFMEPLRYSCSVAKKTYDPYTGQIYVETVTSVQSMIGSWVNHPSRKIKDPKTCRSSGKGVTSLQEVALRHCVFYTFDAGTFEGLPWHIAEKIYNRLKDTCVEPQPNITEVAE